MDHLNASGQPAQFLRFPNRQTTIGQTIDAYLRHDCELDDRAIHLLFSANRWEAAKAMEETLNAGTHLVVDRYAYSGGAFSGAKEGLSMEWCMQSESGLPQPDCIAFMDIAIDAAKDRAAYGEERYEKEAFQRRVRSNFLSLMEQDRSRWHVVDATKSIEELQQELAGLAQACALKVQDTAMERI